MESSPPPSEQTDKRKLTSQQQNVLNCVACFDTRDKAATTPPIAECLGLSTDAVRATVNGLTRHGLLQVQTEEGRRKKHFTPSEEGLRHIRPGFLECETSSSEPPLSPVVQKVLDCAGCLTSNELPVMRASVSACQGISSNSVRYAFDTLQEHGLVRNTTDTQQINSYALLDGAASKMSALQPADCENAALLKTAEPPLSALQKTALDCIKCQAAKGLTPDRTRLQDCTAMGDSSIANTTKALAERDLIIPSGRIVRPMRNGMPQQTYRVTAASGNSRVRQGCEIEEKELQITYGSLSAERKRLLGCLACIESKIDNNVPLPGSSRKLLMECGNPTAPTRNFLRDLVAEGYAKELEGFTGRTVGASFLRLTYRGTLLARQYQEDGQQVPKTCEINFEALPEIPIHRRNAIIKCVGCIWTRQAASGVEPVVTSSMLADCTGLSAHHRDTELARMTEDGLFDARTTSRPYQYLPAANDKTILFGYQSECGVNREQIVDPGMLREIPELTALSAFSARHNSFASFEQFVYDLGLTEIESEEMIMSRYDIVNYGELAYAKLAHDYPLLTAEQEVYLGTIIQTSQDPVAIEKAKHVFTSSNARLAKWMARRRVFESVMTSYEEMYQAAMVGVYAAVKRFDPTMGVKFSTYAYSWMRKEMQEAAATALGVQHWQIASMPAMLSTMAGFRAEHDRNPNLLELSVLLGRSLRKTELLVAAYTKIGGAMSLQRPVGHSAKASELQSFIGQEEVGYDEIDDSDDMFYEVRKHLRPREAQYLNQVIMGGKTLADFARREGITKRQSELIHKMVMSLLRHPYFGLGSTLSSTFSWQESAECFIRKDTAVISPAQSRVQPVTCRICPVKKECHDFALRIEPAPRRGFWGGRTTPMIAKERRAL